ECSGGPPADASSAACGGAAHAGAAGQRRRRSLERARRLLGEVELCDRPAFGAALFQSVPPGFPARRSGATTGSGFGGWSPGQRRARRDPGFPGAACGAAGAHPTGRAPGLASRRSTATHLPDTFAQGGGCDSLGVPGTASAWQRTTARSAARG
ncbi:unnamed protein product, partial [Symbiodinium pilosum]